MQTKIKPLPQLEDDELKTPQHDRLCILLLNKETLRVYIHRDCFIQEHIKQILSSFNKKDKCFEGDYYSRKEVDCEYKLTNYSYELETPILEKVLKTHNGFIIGYLDLWVTIKLKIEYDFIKMNKIEHLQREKLYSFGIEVKPKIKSVGEVIRQLQTYKQHTNSHIVLMSFSKENKEVFEGQGFSFWGD
jgi:hypothetical protein